MELYNQNISFRILFLTGNVKTYQNEGCESLQTNIYAEHKLHGSQHLEVTNVISFTRKSTCLRLMNRNMSRLQTEGAHVSRNMPPAESLHRAPFLHDCAVRFDILFTCTVYSVSTCFLSVFVMLPLGEVPNSGEGNRIADASSLLPSSFSALVLPF
jgi:hypothetical protein